MATTPVPPSELLAVMGSRQLKDDTTVFAGVGIPLLAAALAQQRHAPKLTMVIEGGIMGPQVRRGRLPVSTNEMRAAHRAQMLPGITDTFLYAQRGFLDYGFMGGAQIDQEGEINTSGGGRGATTGSPRSGCPAPAAPTTSHHCAARCSSSPRTRSAASFPASIS